MSIGDLIGAAVATYKLFTATEASASLVLAGTGFYIPRSVRLVTGLVGRD